MFIVKILDGFEKLLKFICTVAMAAIVAILFYAVVMRYVLRMPPAWSMELSRYMFLWLVMLCAVLVTRERSHIKMSYLVGLLPGKIQFGWMTFIRLIMIGFCWIMVQYGWRILPIVSEASSPTLDISMGYMYVSIPVGGALMGIYFIEIIIRSIIDKEWIIKKETEAASC